MAVDADDLDTSVLSASRWIWAASSVQKMPGGLQKAFGGQWNPRYLVLGAHTGCLHWFRDEGPEVVLGPERGHLRLSEVSKVEVIIDDEPQTKRLLLLDALGIAALTIRAASEVVEAWEKAILSAKERGTDYMEGLFTSHGWADLSLMQLVQPPEPLDIDACIEYDAEKVPVMGLAWETQEKPGSPLQCFALKGQRLRFLVISRGRLIRFEPRESALLGERKGEVKLTSFKTIACQNSYVIADEAQYRLIFKAANSQAWASCLRNADAFHCPSPSANSTKPAASESHFTGLLMSPFRCLRSQALLLAWSNAILAGAVALQGSPYFWHFVCAVNFVVLCYGWRAEKPRAEEAEVPEVLTTHTDEPDLASSLRLLAQGPANGCVDDGNAGFVQVRSVGYSAHKEKQPSQQSMYKLQHVFTLPAPANGAKHCHVASSGLDVLQLDVRRPDLPALCIVNIQIPDGAPSLVQGSNCKCSSAIFCFRARAEAEPFLEPEGDPEPAAQLLKQFCQQAESDSSLRSKLKVLCQISESKDSALPSMLQNLSGKPALLGKSVTVYRGDGYIELDIDVASCAYVNRLSLHQMRSRLSSLRMDFAIILQGDSDAELPERVWMCASLNFVDMNDLLQGPSKESSSSLLKLPENSRSPVQKRTPTYHSE